MALTTKNVMTMKQNNIIRMLLAGTFVMTIVSCNNDKLIESGEGQNKTARTEVISVRTESEATKVSVIGTSFSWNDGDKIAVWAGTNATSGSFQECTITGGETSVDLGAGEDRYNYAVYPASVKDASNYGQSTLNVVLPSTYTYAEVSSEKTPLPMIAVNSKDQSKLTFYNVAGLFRIQVKAIPADATGLVLQFAGKKVNGTFAVSNPGTNAPTISNASPAVNEDKITITFSAGTATDMILNIPLPTGDYEEVFITPVGSSTKVGAFRFISAGGYTAQRAHGKRMIATLVSFTLNGKQILFSPGNLRAKTTDLGANWTWSFAQHQYDYVGNASANIAINGVMAVSANGTVDLFGWNGSSSENNSYGINNSTKCNINSGSDYGTSVSDVLKNDWGTLPIVNGGGITWRTPTYADWSQCVPSNSSSARYALYGYAKVCNRGGIILLPDNFVDPKTNTSTNANNTDGSLIPRSIVNSDFNTNIYTSDAWDAMEAAGAIFLPAAGQRSGNKVYMNDSGYDAGFYWSSTSYSQITSTGAIYSMGMYMRANGNTGTGQGPRNSGKSVRLIHEL